MYFHEVKTLTFREKNDTFQNILIFANEQDAKLFISTKPVGILRGISENS